MAQSNELPDSWPFAFVVSSDHIWSGILLYCLLEDAMECQEYLVVKHHGKQKDHFNDLIQAWNQHMRINSQPELTHFCDKCTRWFRDADGISMFVVTIFTKFTVDSKYRQSSTNAQSWSQTVFALATHAAASTTAKCHCKTIRIASALRTHTWETSAPLSAAMRQLSQAGLHVLTQNTRVLNHYMRRKVYPGFSFVTAFSAPVIHIPPATLRTLGLCRSLPPSTTRTCIVLIQLVVLCPTTMPKPSNTMIHLCQLLLTGKYVQN